MERCMEISSNREAFFPCPPLNVRGTVSYLLIGVTLPGERTNPASITKHGDSVIHLHPDSLSDSHGNHPWKQKKKRKDKESHIIPLST